jgi:transposase InsO family protein
MCRVLGIAASGYYAWRGGNKSQRRQQDEIMTKQIQQVHQASHQRYGSPKILQALRQQGVRCGRNRIMRLMRQAGIGANRVRSYKRTTHVNATHRYAPNHLRQQFVAHSPNQIWLGDATFIPTQEGWLYLAAVLDLYSRRIIGWAMGEQMTTELMTTALRMALRQRPNRTKTLLHHSDRGCQYTSHDYQALLTLHGIISSMSATGNCFDNAPMESFFAQLKTELVHHLRYPSRQEAISSIFDYIERFYNRQRIHSALNYLSPVLFEERFSVTTVH